MNPIYGESLYHYGIKGQQWGTRRYQELDGSLTPAGRSRFYAARKARKSGKVVEKGVDFSGNTVKVSNGNKNKKDKKGRLVETNTDWNENNRDEDNGMKKQTEDLQKHSAINEHYESAVKAHLREDSKYQEYRQKAIEEYINSHLSSYNGNRQEMIDKMGDIDDYAMKYYMKDHKNDYFVKGYHATIGNKRTAEREFKKKAKELAYPYEEQRKTKEEREASKFEKRRASIQRQRNQVRNLRAQLKNSNLSVVDKLKLKNKITKLSNSAKSASSKLTADIRKYRESKRAKVGATNETYADRISEAAKRRYFR